MGDVLHANIFFFITSVSVVFVTILMGLVLFYIVSILRDIKKISRRIEVASAMLEGDFSALRNKVQKEGVKVKSILGSFINRVTRKRKRTRKKKA